jgi:hypothetical protein
MISKEIFESVEKQKQLERFVKWSCNRLGINDIPKIRYGDSLEEVEEKRTFGSTHSNGYVWVYVGDRNMADIMRTLCHELVHHRQFEVKLASDDMNDETKQSIEDVANAVAGRLMREYGKQHVEIYS